MWRPEERDDLNARLEVGGRYALNQALAGAHTERTPAALPLGDAISPLRVLCACFMTPPHCCRAPAGHGDSGALSPLPGTVP